MSDTWIPIAPEHARQVKSLARDVLEWVGERACADFSLAGGRAGHAVAAAYAERCGVEGADRLVEQFSREMLESYRRDAVSQRGLFTGTMGVAAAGTYASPRAAPSAQRDLRARSETAIGELLHECTTTFGVAAGSFDLISGLAGSVPLLVLYDDRDARELLAQVASALAGLFDTDDAGRRMRIPHATLPEGTLKAAYSGDLYDLGLAHGAAGVLGALAIAATRLDSRALPGAALAWLAAEAIREGPYIGWPGARELTGESPARITRTAWCYGNPGVARALFLAAGVLADGDMRRLAFDALATVTALPAERRHLDDRFFCHGAAGVLQIYLRFFNDSGDPTYRNSAPELLESLIDTISSTVNARNADANHSLLEGICGTVVVALAATTPEAPAWDRLFLLSG